MSLANWVERKVGIAGALARLADMPESSTGNGAAVPFSYRDKSGYKGDGDVKEMNKRINRAINAPAPIETVRLDELHSIQHSVVPARVKLYIVDPARVPNGKRGDHGGLVDFPIVIEHEGVKYIHDGHHRLTALWLRGKETAQVRYVKLGEKKR